MHAMAKLNSVIVGLVMSAVAVIGEAKADDLSGVFETGASLTKVAGGLRFAEGPVWDGRRLLVSDVQADTVFSVSPDGRLEPYQTPSGWANGHTWDRDGGLIAAEHATGRVTKQTSTGARTVLAERFEGKRLNSPNGVVVARDGTLFFTDPPFGLKPPYGPVERAAELDFAGVYRIDRASGQISLVTKDLKYPNGIVLSADERTLYVNDTATQKVWAFSVEAASAGAKGREVVDLSLAGATGVVDGMRIDEDGRLFITAPGGLAVVSPEGRLLGRLPLPEPGTDVIWGGADRRDLYLTASTSVYRIRTIRPGVGSSWKQ